ncbi:ATP-dependent DNA/RNA helicase [Marasmius crinis-equi]|uniref:ATP-dependent DNA/RNA helicase n=1 Tax=Marasmius crinis-equi TaxID=585013 RepID=A0ABR3F3B8_9AGAR
MSQVTLYSFPTANGVPVSIFLEELGTPYTTVTMSIMDKDIGKVHNQVKSPWFLEKNPNGRIPTVTVDGFNVFETSAILLYLAAEFDKEHKFSFHPIENPKEYSEVLQWLFFTVWIPLAVQPACHPFKKYLNSTVALDPCKVKQLISFDSHRRKLPVALTSTSTSSPYAQNRYLSEVKRLYSVLESRLSQHKWLAGGKYTVADIKTHGWVRGAPKMLDIDLAAEYPSLKDWLDRIEARPAVQKGLNVPAVDIEKAIAELTADADKSK